MLAIAATFFGALAVVCQAAVYDGYSTMTAADPCVIGERVKLSINDSVLVSKVGPVALAIQIGNQI